MSCRAVVGHFQTRETMSLYPVSLLQVFLMLSTLPRHLCNNAAFSRFQQTHAPPMYSDTSCGSSMTSCLKLPRKYYDGVPRALSPRATTTRSNPRKCERFPRPFRSRVLCSSTRRRSMARTRMGRASVCTLALARWGSLTLELMRLPVVRTRKTASLSKIPIMIVL